jgi:hypothetical protein
MIKAIALTAAGIAAAVTISASPVEAADAHRVPQQRQHRTFDDGVACVTQVRHRAVYTIVGVDFGHGHWSKWRITQFAVGSCA